jgi:hypothetical protein|tara:strand:- start:106 stop:213 length:108 start_codon:yes stop_codon:yes gene_type:complete
MMDILFLPKNIISKEAIVVKTIASTALLDITLKQV